MTLVIENGPGDTVRRVTFAALLTVFALVLSACSLGMNSVPGPPVGKPRAQGSITRVWRPGKSPLPATDARGSFVLEVTSARGKVSDIVTRSATIARQQGSGYARLGAGDFVKGAHVQVWADEVNDSNPPQVFATYILVAGSR